MSSSEEHESSSLSKKRKLHRACDACRKKKIRCEPIEDPGDRCSNCSKFGYSKCTYEEVPPKRGRYPDKGYVERLETRLTRLEALFHRLHPNLDLDRLLEQDDAFISSQDEAVTSLSTMASAPRPRVRTPRNSELLTGFIYAAVETPPEPDCDDVVGLKLMESFGGLCIDEKQKGHFFGNSSGVMLLQSAFNIKQELTGSYKLDRSNSRILEHRRTESWSMPTWELRAILETSPSLYQFPDDDLMSVLIDSYFEYVHIFLPFLHRPTFERSIKDGLHLRHKTFGAIVLLVCANGSRHSDDPRVLLEDSNSKLSRGWKWFMQVQVVRQSLLCSPTLYDLQFYILAIRFLQGSSVGHASWILIGVALRIAQEVGVHRKTKNSNSPSIDNELWKRAFWSLIVMDRVMSSLVGRPSAISDEDFDLDFPLEVDDEYWEHPDPNQTFKQPPNKPSLISSFNHSLRLTHILEQGRRALYCSNKSKLLLGLVGEWEPPIVAQLDSLMNNWIDSLPEHLRWDRNRKSGVFFHQSAELYCQYYYVQMVVHRPFLRTSSPLALPSLAICTNAARNCSNIVHVHNQMAPDMIIPLGTVGAFSSSIVLLLHSWSAKRSGLATNQQKDLLDVHKCMQVLKRLEDRSIIAGRLWDILCELANVGDLPLPRPSVGQDTPDGSFSSPDIGVASSSDAVLTQTPSSQANSPPRTDNLGAPTSPPESSFMSPGGRMLNEVPLSRSHMTPMIHHPELSAGNFTDPDRDFYGQFLSSYQDPLQRSMPLETTAGWPAPTDNRNPQNAASIPQQVMFDNDTMDMWMSAPFGFELEDWGRYLSNVDDLTHGTQYSAQ